MLCSSVNWYFKHVLYSLAAWWLKGTKPWYILKSSTHWYIQAWKFFRLYFHSCLSCVHTGNCLYFFLCSWNIMIFHVLTYVVKLSGFEVRLIQAAKSKSSSSPRKKPSSWAIAIAHLPRVAGILKIGCHLPRLPSWHALLLCSVYFSWPSKWQRTCCTGTARKQGMEMDFLNYWNRVPQFLFANR